MKSILVSFIVAFFIIVAGCNDAENTAASLEKKVKEKQYKEKEIKKKIEKKEASVTENDDEDDAKDTSEKESQKEEVDNNFIEKQFKLGTTKQEVNGVLGEPDAIGVSAMDGFENWRYDFAIDPDYDFEESEEFKEMGVVDTVDGIGLKSGKMRMQLFISWTKEGKIKRLTNYYANDSVVTEYRLFDDGTIRETQLNF